MDNDSILTDNAAFIKEAREAGKLRTFKAKKNTIGKLAS